jgi:hypothetical protein
MALDPIVIDFIARGVTDISGAFNTVIQQAEKLERHRASAAARGSKDRIKTAQDEEKQKAKAASLMAKEKEKIERQITRDAAQEAARRDGIVRKSSEMRGRMAVQEAKADVRAAQEATRGIEREEERRMRLRIRSSEMAGRQAARDAAMEIRNAQQVSSAWGQRGRRAGGIVAGSVGNLFSGAGAMVGATMGIGGGMILANAARSEMSASKSAQLLVNSVTTGGTAPPGATVAAVLGQASMVAKAEGVDKGAVVDAALSYSRSAKGGDFNGAIGNMGFLAKVSNVTGADMSELASAAGTLQSQNQGLDTKGMQQLLLDVLAQTHQGSLSMPEVAKMAGVVGSARGAFGGDEGVNQRKLLGLAQLVAPETDPAEAGTMIKDLATEGQKHFEKLGKLGVKYNPQGQMESIEQTIDSVLTGSKGNQGKILEAFGSDRGAKLFEHLTPIYNKEGGGAAGLEAVHKEMAGVMGATMSVGDLDKRDKETQDEPARKLSAALNQITTELGDSLEPRIKDFADNTLPKLIPKFEAIIEEATKFAGWFADNPLYGIGTVVLAAITKDLAAAKIGDEVKSIFARIFQGVGGAPPPAGAGGGVSLLPVLAAGAAGAYAAQQAVDTDTAAQAAGQRTEVGRLVEDTNLASRLRSGKVSPADIAQAQAEAASLSKDWTAKGKEITNPKLSGDEWLTVGLAKATGQGDKADELIAAKQRAAAQQYDMIGKTVRELDAALAALAKRTNTVPAPPDPARHLSISERPWQ